MSDNRYHVVWIDGHEQHSETVNARDIHQAQTLLRQRRRVKQVLSIRPLAQEQEETEETEMEYEDMDELRERIANMASGLSEGAQEELIDLFETAVSLRSTSVLAETICNLGDAVAEAENRAQLAEEGVENLTEVIAEYLDEIVAPEVELCREESDVLLNLLDAMVSLSPDMTAEKVFKRAADLARRNAVDNSSGSEWGGGVRADDAERNRASVRGNSSSRGVNSQGDQGGVVKEQVEAARVQAYVDFMNRRPGLGLLSPKPITLSQAAPQALSEAEIDKRYAEIARGDRIAQAVDEIERKRRLGLIMR